MKYLVIVLLFLTNFQICRCQNLIPNGDFELFYGCPDQFSQIDSTMYWFSPSTLGSPDYYHSCGSTEVGVPSSGIGFQDAQSGDAYAGILLYNSAGTDKREYIETPLISSLIANTLYRFEMYVNISNSSIYTTENIGVYFSDTVVIDIEGWDLLPFDYQIINTDGNILDSLNWTLISGTYMAEGGERFLIIGNFESDSTSNFIQTNYGNFPVAYSLIDNVSLVNAQPSSNSLITNASKISISPNPFSHRLTIMSNHTDVSDIIIYDFTSNVVVRENFKGSIDIDTKLLNSGTYFYKVINKNSCIQTGKLMKI